MKPLFVILLSILLNSCVSVQLANKARVVSSQLTYTPPSTPFAQISNLPADKAWQSEKTGNVISFISACNNQSDPELEALQSETLAVLQAQKIINSNYIDFNDRVSLQTLAEGKIDGVPVKLHVIIFKKNNCDYTLSYSARDNTFDKEFAIYKHFTEGFRTP